MGETASQGQDQLDATSVDCPRCGVMAGGSCPPPKPCASRIAAARLQQRLTDECGRRNQMGAAGIARCRAALAGRAR